MKTWLSLLWRATPPHLMFFPLLFKEAFTKSRLKIVKHLGATWPYPNLYIGPLKHNFNAYNIKGVFYGIDWLSGQNVWPQRCTLKELYLLDMKHDFLVIMNPRQDYLYIPQPQLEEEDTTVLKKPLTVYADSAFMADSLKHYCDFLDQGFNKRLNTMSLNFK
ncbi:oogenesin-3-like [Mastomys coucha]|uniref:oogenesin-3-like n=1 Tax=Mastomys coucha TaxID=35658 RepID=UPI0012621B87|nr:oogenesin-3-like [Mastomys coucha]